MATLSIDISPGRRDALPPRLARTARELGYVLLGLPVGIATFTLGVTGLSLGVGLAVTLVGIPVILLTCWPRDGWPASSATAPAW